jgi:pimeloyl-ACP methyl ester carboxylesterase
MNRRSLLAGGAMLLASGKAAIAAAPTRFVVRVTGKGPDVILIPGLTCAGEVWDETVARLSSTHRCHVLTVAGFGTVPAGPNATGPVLDPLVDELAAYIAAETPGRPAVIGHSVGGTIGQMLVLRHPQSVGRLLIVDAFPFTGLMFGAAAPAQIEPQLRMLRERQLAMSEDSYDAGQPAQVRGLVKSQSGYEKALAWARAADKRVVSQVIYEAGVLDMRPQIGSIQIPVTVLYAFDAARGAPADYIDSGWRMAYANRPQTKMVRIDEAGHFIMFDQPERFVREVEAFLG